MVMYDVIVIGAGVNGSSAAYTLSKRNKTVLLIEQFPLPHVRGSSHGQTRIFRCLYEQDIYAKMSSDSIPLWRDMEQQVNETLLIQNGMLEIFEKRDVERITNSKHVLQKLGVSYEYLTNEEIIQRFKPIDLPNEYCGIHENHGGTLMANKCVASFQKLFVKNGGVLHENEQVVEVIPGDICTVVTNKQTYKTKALIITAGPFSSKLLKPLGLRLPLQVKRTHLCFWKLSETNVGSLETGFPSFILPSHTYGLASFEYPGLLKICYHGGIAVDIDYPDRSPDLSALMKVIKTFFKNVALEPSIVENCLYTTTPDENFIIDYHPKHHNIVIGAGFSGTGFKMSPITGEILADMSLGISPAYDLSELRMGRFKDIMEVKSAL